VVEPLREHGFGRPPVTRLFDRKKHRSAHLGKSRHERAAEVQREYYNRDSELILSDTTQAHPVVQGPEDFLVGDLNSGTKPDVDKSQQSQLPEQVRFQVFLANTVFFERLAKLAWTMEPLGLELLQHRFHVGGVRLRVASHLDFFSDEFLFDEPARGRALGFSIEVQGPAVLKCGEPDFQQNFTFGDHLVIQSDGDAIDDIGARACEPKSGEENDTRQHQKLCPIEKKNWKWLMLWFVRREGVFPQATRSFMFPLQPKKLGGLML